MNQPELPGDIGRVRFTPPTLDQVTHEGEKIGLPQEECELFHSYFQSNGWKVGRVAMKSWRDALNGWKIRWQKRQRYKQEPTAYQMKMSLDAKRLIADKLKRQYCIEGPLNSTWTVKAKRDEYVKLQREMRELIERLAKMF